MASTDIDGSTIVILSSENAQLVLAIAARCDVLFQPEVRLCEKIVRDLELKAPVEPVNPQPPQDKFDAFMAEVRQRVSCWPEWKQRVLGGEPITPHISPNGAEPGSIVHDAEAWMLKQGLTIPLERKHRNLYQAMIDDYSDSQ